MAITLADKHRGQGRRLRVPVGERPINTQAFSLTSLLAGECEEIERQAESAQTNK